MDEAQGQANPQTTAQHDYAQQQVGADKSNSGGGKKKIIIIVLIIVLLLVLVGGGYFILQAPDIAEPETTPTGVSLSAPTPTAIPSPVEEEEVDFSSYSVNVLNGTGIGGEAGFLQEELETLGFEDIDVGNASNTDHETTLVVFGSDVSEAAQTQLVEALSGIYEEVESEVDEDLTDYDIEITTGLREGQTPAPADDEEEEEEEEATPTPTATATNPSNLTN